MTGRRVVVVLLGAAALAFFAAAPSVAQTEPRCALADATAAAGQLGPALQLYDGLAPELPCRASGRESVIRRQHDARALLNDAREASRLERKDEAIRLTNEALRVDQSLAEARAFLTQLTGPADPFAGALNLFDAGYKDEARAEARKVLVEKAPNDTIPEKLQKPGRSNKDRLDGFVATTTAALGAAGLALAILAVPALWLRKRYGKPRVVLEPFTDPAGAKSLPTGRMLTNLLVEEILSRGTGSSLERIADAPATPNLDLGSALGPQWKWLGSVVNAAVTPRTITVRAQAHANGDHDVTVILTLVRSGGHLAESRAFTKDDGELSATDLFALVIREAASWLTQRLVECGAADRTPMLGTTSWESWGHFRQGVWFQEARQQYRARAAYVDAVAHDHANGAAWINLASLDVRNADTWNRALERLELIETILRDRERTEGTSPLTSPLWYRSQYLRAVTLLHRSVDQGTAEQRALDKINARKAMNELVRALAMARLVLLEGVRAPDGEVFSSMSKADKADLRNVILNTEDSAIALLASATVELGDTPPVEPQPLVGPPNDLVGRFATLGENATAAEILGLLWGLHRRGGLPWNAEYNLGCMYARAHEKAPADQQPGLADQALQHLARGLEGRAPDVLGWASDKDPALRSLRTGDPKAAFDKMIERARPPRKGLALTEANGWKVTVGS